MLKSGTVISDLNFFFVFMKVFSCTDSSILCFWEEMVAGGFYLATLLCLFDVSFFYADVIINVYGFKTRERNLLEFLLDSN